MILKNRLFVRKPASRDAKSIYIFCEGAKREYQYFEFFTEIDSRINIEIYKLSSDEDNSPQGLYNIAYNSVIKSNTNPNPKYEFLNEDELWIVLDTDNDRLESRKPQIEELRKNCKKYDWKVAQSNPCFEVWLYNHFFSERLIHEDISTPKFWKKIVSERIAGGFNSKKHPIHIKTAIINSENNHKENQEVPNIGSTQVYKLAKVIYPMIEDKFVEILDKSTEKIID